MGDRNEKDAKDVFGKYTKKNDKIKTDNGGALKRRF